jgi:D-lactate dehydrogenase
MKPPVIAFCDSKSYEIDFFEEEAKEKGIEFKYFNNRLNSDTVAISRGFDGVCGFVNDDTLPNELCYKCDNQPCRNKKEGRCF